MAKTEYSRAKRGMELLKEEGIYALLADFAEIVRPGISVNDKIGITKELEMKYYKTIESKPSKFKQTKLFTNE